MFREVRVEGMPCVPPSLGLHGRPPPEHRRQRQAPWASSHVLRSSLQLSAGNILFLSDNIQRDMPQMGVETRVNDGFHVQCLVLLPDFNLILTCQ
jgi:hypothetical protein